MGRCLSTGNNGMSDRVWVTSDTHFWHRNILTYCERPYYTVEAMNDDMVFRWNDKVEQSDTVIHLGDVSFGDAAQTVDTLSRLNGKMYLIAGNHDRNARWSKKEPNLLQRFFREVVDYKRYRHNNRKYVLCHFPFASWERGYINLHGHTHGNYVDLYSQLDVGADCHDLTPILIDDAARIALDNTKPSQYT